MDLKLIKEQLFKLNGIFLLFECIDTSTFLKTTTKYNRAKIKQISFSYPHPLSYES